jgi:hypothetical protein
MTLAAPATPVNRGNTRVARGVCRLTDPHACNRRRWVEDTGASSTGERNTSLIGG